MGMRFALVVLCLAAFSIGPAQERAPLKLSHEGGAIRGVATASTVRLVRGDFVQLGNLPAASSRNVYLQGMVTGATGSVDVVAFASIIVTSPKGEKYTVRVPVHVRDLRKGEVRFLLEHVSLPSIVAAQITDEGLQGELVVMSCQFPTTREYPPGAQKPRFDVTGDEYGMGGRPWILPEVLLTSTAALSKQPGFESNSTEDSGGTYALVKMTPRSPDTNPIQLCVSMELRDEISGSSTGARLMDIREGQTGYALCFLGHTDDPKPGGDAPVIEDFVPLARPGEGESSGTLQLELFSPTFIGIW